MLHSIRRTGSALLVAAGAAFALAGCEVTLEPIDWPDGTVDGRLVRLGVANLTPFDGAQVHWAVYGDEDTAAAPLASGQMDGGAADSVVHADIDATEAFADAGGTLTLTAVVWFDLDGDDAEHASEPTTRVTATFSADEPVMQETDAAGRIMAVHGMDAVVRGGGGLGTPDAPAEPALHQWITFAQFSGGASYLRLVVPVAGPYAVVVRPDPELAINPGSESDSTTLTDGEGHVIAVVDVAARAVGDVYDFAIELPATDGETPAVRDVRLLLMRLPLPGDNAAHAIVDDGEFGLGGLEIFPFASQVTTDVGGGEWVGGNEITFARPATGDETGDPQIVWANYEGGGFDAANAADFRYIDHEGQTYVADLPCGRAFDGFQVITGGLSDYSRGGSSCTIESHGKTFHVTAFFQR